MNRFVNTLLLVLLSFLGLSGVLMLYGAWLPWIFDLHRIVGFSLLAIAPWKGLIIYRSLRRGIGSSFDRSSAIYASLIFLTLVLVVILLALAWMWRLGSFSYLTQTLIAWHWILGLAIIPLFLFHLWRRWSNPRLNDLLSRREFFKLVGVATVGVLGGWLASSLGNALAAVEQPGQAEPRRFTGSRRFGAVPGEDFPLTGEAPPPLDLKQWHLSVTRAGFSPLALAYSDLLRLPHSQFPETIDCTSGWYSFQNWAGTRLVDLLARAGTEKDYAGVRLVSVTGYNHTFPFAEASKILLATHIGDQVLTPIHGFPLRAVVPGRRGWFWVKWLARVEVLESPGEVTLGILTSPRQVLRQW